MGELMSCRRDLQPEAWERNLADVLSEVAGRSAQQSAIRHDGGTLTYAQLAAWADGIAGVVKAADIDPSAPLVAVIGAEWALPAALWACWKCGRLAVPIDAAQPEQRIGEIVADVGPGAVLTDAPLTAAVGRGLVQINVHEVPHGRDFTPSHAEPGAPAVVLYTSGSDGRPKGVLQTHRNLVRSIAGYNAALAVTQCDRFPLLASMCGGQGLSTALLALCHGACLCFWDVRRRGLAGIDLWLAKESATILVCSPSLFRRLLDVVNDDRPFGRMRAVKLGGEAVWSADVQRFRKRFGDDCRLMHSLSSSETLSVSFGFVESWAVVQGDRVAVGVESPGVEVLLVDDALRPVTSGEVGQIVVRSRYLSPGYWGQAQATDAVFQPDPDDPTQRCYHTGDLGRRLEDGQLVHCGRSDGQVQIRANRVEPAEVERRVRELPEIADCALIPVGADGPDIRLDLFYQLSDAAALPVADLRRELGTVLPPYMMPSRLVRVERMPYSANGKVDRQALRAVDRPPHSAADDQPVDSGLQFRLKLIWEEVFGFPVGLHADFFELGGSSLTAMALLAKVQRELGVTWPPSFIQVAPTIAMMARCARTAATGPRSSLVPLSRHQGGVRLFCVHGVGGHTMRFHALAQSLSDRVSLIGLQSPGFERIHTQRLGIADLARIYIEDIERAGTIEGSVLAGYSLGGQVALEMACHLRRMGCAVPLVVLLDTLHPDGAIGRRSRHSHWTRARDHVREGLGRMWSQLAYYLHKRRSGVVPSRLQLRLTSEALRRAAVRHQLPAYDGKIVLFQTAERAGLDKRQTWRRYPGLRIETLAGDHNTFLTSPHVESLAARLEVLCADALGV